MFFIYTVSHTHFFLFLHYFEEKSEILNYFIYKYFSKQKIRNLKNKYNYYVSKIQSLNLHVIIYFQNSLFWTRIQIRSIPVFSLKTFSIYRFLLHRVFFFFLVSFFHLLIKLYCLFCRFSDSWYFTDCVPVIPFNVFLWSVCSL